MKDEMLPSRSGDDRFEVPVAHPGPFNRDVDVLLFDYAHRVQHPEDTDAFWNKLRVLIGDRADDFVLSVESGVEGSQVMLVPRKKHASVEEVSNEPYFGGNGC